MRSERVCANRGTAGASERPVICHRGGAYSLPFQLLGLDARMCPLLSSPFSQNPFIKEHMEDFDKAAIRRSEKILKRALSVSTVK